MKKSPCFKCEDRRQGCHSVCPLYLEWSGEIQDRREWLKKGYVVFDYQHEQISRKIMANQRKTKIVGGGNHEK